jgi:DNA-binding beta-propeller fold protein YncE
MKTCLAFALVMCATLQAQRPPSPTELGGHPFYITKTWVVGGVGDWDYLTMDPVARHLFIAHGPTVQVVDVSTGTLAGTVSGIRQAHAVALDPEGAFGYVTDGPASAVKVFDRRSFEVVASIPTGPAPRALALEPQTRLLFVIGSQPAERDASAADVRPAGVNPSAKGSSAKPTGAPRSESTVTVIDIEARKALAQVVLSGSLGFAQADGNGLVYISVADRSQIMRLDAQAVSTVLHGLVDSPNSPQQAGHTGSITKTLVLDWTRNAAPPPPVEVGPRLFSLGSECQEPRAIAVDATHQRLFAACTNMKMVVLNGDTGESIVSVPIGPGADAIGYDANRGLIFSANGGGDGSLTVIQQDVTDTYAVVQILPTRQRARTLAINSSTGEVYLATVISGAVINRPPVNGAPLKMSAVDSSFQVLVIGN